MSIRAKQQEDEFALLKTKLDLVSTELNNARQEHQVTNLLKHFWW